MATYYKYAERTADSQINWAEIGKNMTDMLQQEVAIRDEKKAALDEATRKAAEQISNSPQGQHQSAKSEAIRLADQSSKYLLMQNRLMKQGLLEPRDYMISSQNLSDGIKQAYKSMKAFQDNYAKLMERAQTDVSSAIELARLEKVQGYGNFNQSGFFIDAPTGNLNVGLKEEQIIDGKKVIGLKKGSSVGMQYIDGAIYGQIDKFKYRDSLKQMADGVGEFVTATITPGTLSSIGYVTTISDARKRIDEMKIGSDDKKILYDFYASSYDTINSILTNENYKASLLVDSMASKGYFWTDDADVAAKNSKAVLEVIDPNTGRGVMQFSEEQNQAASEFMMQQFLGMIDVKETKASTGVVPRQDASAAVLDRGDKKAAEDAAAGAWNQLYTGVTAAEKDAAAETLLGTPIAKEAGLLDIDLREEGKIKLIYKDPEDNRTIDYLDANNNPISLRDFSGLGVELHGVVDRDRAVRAGGGGSGFGRVSAEELATVKASREGVAAEGQTPLEELNSIVSSSFNSPFIPQYIDKTEGNGTLATQFNKFIAPGLSGVEFKPSKVRNSVFVVVNGKESPLYAVGNKAKNTLALSQLQKFIMDNYAAGATLEEKEMAAEATLSGLPNRGGVGSRY